MDKARTIMPLIATTHEHNVVGERERTRNHTERFVRQMIDCMQSPASYGMCDMGEQKPILGAIVRVHYSKPDELQAAIQTMQDAFSTLETNLTRRGTDNYKIEMYCRELGNNHYQITATFPEIYRFEEHPEAMQYIASNKKQLTEMARQHIFGNEGRYLQ